MIVRAAKGSPRRKRATRVVSSAARTSVTDCLLSRSQNRPDRARKGSLLQAVGSKGRPGRGSARRQDENHLCRIPLRRTKRENIEVSWHKPRQCFSAYTTAHTSC